jgi:iron complex transport system substrate-binding protein
LKKIVRVLLAAALTAGVFTGCTGSAPSGAAQTTQTTQAAQAAETTQAAAAQAEQTTEAAAAVQTAETATAQAAAETGERRIVETVNGPVEIPANPERIASALIGISGFLAAVDVVPVATATQSGFPDYLKDALAGSVDLGDTSALDMEALLACEPELILASPALHAEQYGLLSEIAPTVMVDTANLGEWEAFLFTADIVGKEAEGLAMKADYDARYADITGRLKTAYPDGARVVYTRIQEKEIQALNPDSIYYEGLYREMNWISATGGIVDFGDGWNATISWEILPELDMDYMIVAVRPDEVSQQAVAELSNSAIWNSLNVVRNGSVAMVDANIWFAGFDPLALNIRLDDIETLMLAPR